MKDFVTLSHDGNGKPLHRIRNRVVPFHSRYSIDGFDYHCGFFGKDGVHYANVIRKEPVQPGDEQYTDANALIEESAVQL